jgi:hypothetical protein
MSMDVIRQKAETMVSHIVDPVQKAKKLKIMIRVLTSVELPPDEVLRRDDGCFDGLPVHDVETRAVMEQTYVASLRAMRSSIFDLPEPIEKPETEEDRLNKRGRFGYTRLHQSVVNQDYPLMADLLMKGIDFDIQDNGGSTAFDKAYLAGDKEAIKIFHKFGIHREICLPTI